MAAEVLQESSDKARQFVAKLDYVAEFRESIYNVTDAVSRIQGRVDGCLAAGASQAVPDEISGLAQNILAAVREAYQYIVEDLKLDGDVLFKNCTLKEVRDVFDKAFPAESQKASDNRLQSIHSSLVEVEKVMMTHAVFGSVQVEDEATRSNNLITDPLSADNAQEARDFWGKISNGSRFCSVHDFITAVMKKCPNLSQLHDFKLHSLLDITEDNRLSAKEFNLLLHFFGPFNKLFDRLSDAVLQGYFHGYITLEETEAVFDGEVPPALASVFQTKTFRHKQAFVLRLSLGKPGTFRMHYISKKDGDERPSHVRTAVLRKEGYTTLDNKTPVYYDTVSEWVKKASGSKIDMLYAVVPPYAVNNNYQFFEE